MPLGEPLDVARLVEPDRAHRACYVDDEIFAREMEYIHHKTLRTASSDRSTG